MLIKIERWPPAEDIIFTGDYKGLEVEVEDLGNDSIDKVNAYRQLELKLRPSSKQ